VIGPHAIGSRFRWRARAFECELLIMMTRALAAGCGLLGLCAPLLAQQLAEPTTDVFTLRQLTQSRVAEISSEFGRQINSQNSLAWLSPLALSQGPLFSSTDTLAWVDVARRSTARTSNAQRVSAPAAESWQDFSELRPNRYATGEIGLTYGKSFGKFGGEYKSGYAISEFGDDKTHITVGTFYEESSARGPRFGR
jgi:hypothetical protein